MKSQMEYSNSEILNLGLSKYEMRAYVSLVLEGMCEARKLSLKCGVPRTKIYATLNKLKERGLVYELPVEPQKFAPEPPSGVFGSYLSYVKEDISERVISLIKLREAVCLLQEEYSEKQMAIEPKKEEVWIIQSQSKIVEKIKELLSHAKRGVTLIATDEDFVFFCKTFGKILDNLNKDNVEVTIGTEINFRNKNLAREFSYICKVKNLEFHSRVLYLSVDKQFYFLAKLNHDSSIKNEKNFGVLWTNSSLTELLSLLCPNLS